MKRNYYDAVNELVTFDQLYIGNSKYQQEKQIVKYLENVIKTLDACQLSIKWTIETDTAGDMYMKKA